MSFLSQLYHRNTCKIALMAGKVGTKEYDIVVKGHLGKEMFSQATPVLGEGIGQVITAGNFLQSETFLPNALLQPELLLIHVLDSPHTTSTQHALSRSRIRANLYLHLQSQITSSLLETYTFLGAFVSGVEFRLSGA